MATQSKRSQRRMQQHGLGGRLRLVHRMPAAARRLPHAPTLNVTMELRLRCLEHAHPTSVADAAPPPPHAYPAVNPSPGTGGADLRQQHPRYGTAKLVFLLRARAVLVFASTVGRILASPMQRNLLIEPHAVWVRHRRSHHPYATRVPTDRRQPMAPGQLVQRDTMHLRPLPGVERRQVTAIDVVSRCAALGVHSQATAGLFWTSSMRACRCGSERSRSMAAPNSWPGSKPPVGQEGSRSTCCHQVLPTRNGRVERHNGTVRREYWPCNDCDLELPTFCQTLRH